MLAEPFAIAGFGDGENLDGGAEAGFKLCDVFGVDVDGAAEVVAVLPEEEGDDGEGGGGEAELLEEGFGEGFVEEVEVEGLVGVDEVGEGGLEGDDAVFEFLLGGLGWHGELGWGGFWEGEERDRWG